MVDMTLPMREMLATSQSYPVLPCLVLLLVCKKMCEYVKKPTWTLFSSRHKSFNTDTLTCGKTPSGKEADSDMGCSLHSGQIVDPLPYAFIAVDLCDVR